MMVMSLKPEESLVEAGFPVPELPTRLPTQSDPSGACPGHHHYNNAFVADEDSNDDDVK